MRFAFAVISLGWALAIGSPVQAEEPRLVLGQFAESVHQVAGAVVQAVLERLGHEVEVHEARPIDLFPLFRDGKIDILVGARLPNAHRFYWERDGADAIDLATLYDGARLFWAVPDYIPENQVASIADLAKKKVAERMDPIVIGITPGPDATFRTMEVLRLYGLRKLEYDYRFSPLENPYALNRPLSDTYSELAIAVQHGDWVVAAVAQPSYVHHTLSLRPLADPKGVLGGTDRTVLAVRRGILDRLPAKTLGTLKRIRLSLEAINMMDDLVLRTLVPAEEAARRWMAQNPKVVEAWFAE